MHFAMQLDYTAPIADGPLRGREVATPEPGPGQLRIRVAGCGVCRSNLHMIEGDWPGLPAIAPIVPGHEVTGIVDAVGADVEGFAIGDRVGVQPLWSTCEECEYCVSGREQYCLQRLITGEMVDGGYQEQMLAMAAHTYRVPEGLDLVEAAPLFCPGITAYGAIARLDLTPGSRVAIFGLGGVGHMAVQFAKLAGAEVTAVARGRDHLDVARELGADHLVDASDAAALAALEATMDAAVIFAPSDEVAQRALASVRRGGTVVLGVIASFGTITFAEGKTIIESMLGNRAQMDEVLALAAAGKVRTVVDVFPLREAPEVLERLAAGGLRSRAVLRV
ncbi:MAG TPA: alcohol dehydrogenase catalytic domain-containing protein [Microbacteriaceae bacterium]|nr:alcohol dehydrogenase catalytic domain-containing protein [Microbacteriaceae bacterium]